MVGSVSYTVGAVGFGAGWANPEVLVLEDQLREARAQIALLEAEREILLKKLEGRDDRKETP